MGPAGRKLSEYVGHGRSGGLFTHSKQNAGLSGRNTGRTGANNTPLIAIIFQPTWIQVNGGQWIPAFKKTIRSTSRAGLQVVRYFSWRPWPPDWDYSFSIRPRTRT